MGQCYTDTLQAVTDCTEQPKMVIHVTSSSFCQYIAFFFRFTQGRVITKNDIIDTIVPNTKPKVKKNRPQNTIGLQSRRVKTTRC